MSINSVQDQLIVATFWTDNEASAAPLGHDHILHGQKDTSTRLSGRICNKEIKSQQMHLLLTMLRENNGQLNVSKGWK